MKIPTQTYKDNHGNRLDRGEKRGGRTIATITTDTGQEESSQSPAADESLTKRKHSKGRRNHKDFFGDAEIIPQKSLRSSFYGVLIAEGFSSGGGGVKKN